MSCVDVCWGLIERVILKNSFLLYSSVVMYMLVLGLEN